MPRRIVGGYEILDRIGAGRVGVVYAGRDMRLDRPVAVKMLDPRLCMDEGFARRLEEAAGLLAGLRHEGIAGVIELVQHRGQYYVVSEYVDGPTLRDVLEEEGGGLGVVRALGIAGGVCRALRYAQERGVRHGALSCANVKLLPADRVKVCDFVVAAVAAASGADPLSVLAAEYASPEVLRGDEAAEASDVWSLGVLLYELAVGEVPLSASAAAGLARGDGGVTVRWPEGGALAVPKEVRELVRRALEVDPAARPAMEEMAEGIAAALGAAERSSPPESLSPRRRYRLAVELYRAGRLKQALGHLEAALAAKADYARARSLAGRIRAALAEGAVEMPGGGLAGGGMPVPKGEALDTALRRAAVLARQGRYRAAEVWYRRALALDGANEAARRGLVSCRRAAARQAGRLVRAVALAVAVDLLAVGAYAGWALLRRQTLAAWWVQGTAAFAAARWSDAAEAFRKLALRRPQYRPDGYANPAGIYLIASEEGRALSAEYERLRRLARDKAAVAGVSAVLDEADDALTAAESALSQLQVVYASSMRVRAGMALDGVEPLVDLAGAKARVALAREAVSDGLGSLGRFRSAVEEAEAVVDQAERALSAADYARASDLAAQAEDLVCEAIDEAVSSARARLSELAGEAAALPEDTGRLRRDLAEAAEALAARVEGDEPRFAGLKELVDGDG